jgi:hypothetical protein
MNESSLQEDVKKLLLLVQTMFIFITTFIALNQDVCCLVYQESNQ